MSDVNFPRDMVLSEQSKGPDELVAGGNRQMKHEVAASTIGAPISETSPTVPPPLPMPAPEAFASEHLAMDRNPVTTAQASWVDPSTSLKRSSSTAFTTPAPPVSTPAQEKNTGSGQSSESSTAGGAAAQVTKSTSRITFDDYLSLSEITFEWGDSYDDKDWMRLRAILAPTLMVDYTEVNGHKWDSMPASDFVGIMSHIGFIGDPLVHTQHHIGASKWQKISDEEVIGHHQLRAAHQRYTSLDLKVVENKGHGHAMVQHLYRKVGGEWKLAGLRPTVRWNEFEFEKIFKGF